jgi:hypothetical protein
MNAYFRYLWVASFFFICSCIRNVSVPIRTVPPTLVVEGWVTTDPPPYLIKLSYSGAFTNTYQANVDSLEQFITDAQVTLLDDLGDTAACIQAFNGTYQTIDPNFIGTIGRTYTLKIHLSNGKIFLSKPEKIMPVPPIDSVTVVYDSSSIALVRPTQLIVQASTHDPAGVQNFYRWTASGYFPRKSWGNLCSFPYFGCADPFSCLCFALCEQFQPDDQINVLSDQFIDGGEISRQPVFYSPIYWEGSHYIEIKQYSLSQEAYQFWEQYLNQTNRTGSILDPLPASLTGNIYNQADSTDIALGLFSASAATTKKVIIMPDFLQIYLLESIAGYYDQPGECDMTYPNTLPDNAIPPGWDSAQVIEMH